jgi:putative membrane-bound dehydrogenase-like protein
MNPSHWQSWALILAVLATALSPQPSAGIEPEVDEPLAAETAAATMIVPEGFRVALFAGEPHVQQPIGFSIDDRGRLWVAEAYNYPNHGTKPGDRIIILEDVDHDGRFDKRTVFYDQLNYVSGIEVGFGGAWVMSPPYFYFIPDRDGDDRPDSEPQVLLDGFGNHANAHNMANGFAWGPDGWLYGTHGRTNWSTIGKPGTPDDQRVRFDGGVYRYHPITHQWEPYADGTTNPWGIDWNDVGEAFVCNCVDPHLFHVIQGAHYEPWRNRQSSQYAYERIASIADHLHFVGTTNVRDGLGSHEEDTAGGGHAHCGTMVYLGDNWPARYRNHVFMNNIHGKRINNDLLSRAGSGYTASHGPDVMRSQDPWYMGVTLLYGPDGAVFASDWSDTGECHSTKNTRRHTGRIYKISYGQPPQWKTDLTKLSDAELVGFQLHANDWQVRHARRLLQERYAAGADLSSARRALQAMYASQTDVPRKLRALWALHVIGGLDDTFLISLLDPPLSLDGRRVRGEGEVRGEGKVGSEGENRGEGEARGLYGNEYLRAWAIKLLCEDRQPPREALERFAEMADKDSSPYERLHLACALQRLPHDQRWPIATALATHVEDASDQNLPLMLWYAVEPLVEADLARYIQLATSSRIPLLRKHIARRAASSQHADTALKLLAQQISDTRDAQVQLDLVQGMLLGLEGVRSAPMPSTWPAAYAVLSQTSNVQLRDAATELALVFDDPTALGALWKQAGDVSLPPAMRVRAVEALAKKQPPELAPLLLGLLADPATQGAALRGLAQYDHPATLAAVLDRYDSLAPAARQDALQLLASRPQWARGMLDALEAGRIPRSDVTAFTVRQLENLRDDKLSVRLLGIWGEVRATPADKARAIASYKRKLTPAALQSADASAGRLVFQKICANCHKLFDAGASIGPEITGAQRRNLDYLLENLVDPSAAVSRDYQMQIIETTGGRIITGLAVAESNASVTIQTINEKLVIPASEIADRTTARVSMMPDNILQTLSFEQVRDLVAYLASPGQVPIPSGVSQP